MQDYYFKELSIYTNAEQEMRFSLHKNNYCDFYSLCIHLSYINRPPQLHWKSGCPQKHIYITSGVEGKGGLEGLGSEEGGQERETQVEGGHVICLWLLNIY